ncbi:MAG: hypothetical protein IKK21_00520 [Clostridia bacterium]|nr:hypothetical protein [Clostridia bacterium]
MFGNRKADPNASTFSSNAGNRSDNRTSWSGRYSGGVGGMTVNKGGLPRWLPAVTAALVVVVLALGIIGIPAITFRMQSEETFVNRMLTECNDALSLANGLSRSGGAESAATLGRIRAYIHAVDAINEVRNTITGGGYFVQPQVFTELYGVIDSYSNNLKLGSATMQDLTALVTGLENLRSMILLLQ